MGFLNDFKVSNSKEDVKKATNIEWVLSLLDKLRTLASALVSKTANGLTPQLPNETTTTKFLRQDGTWEVPDNNTTYEKMPNGANLNNYITSGHYVKESTSTAVSNAPANSYSFFLEVLKNNDRLVQVLQSSYNGNEWIRTAYFNSWTEQYYEWEKQVWSLGDIYPKTYDDLYNWIHSNFDYVEQIENVYFNLFDYYYYQPKTVITVSTNKLASRCENTPSWSADLSFLLFIDDSNNLALLNSVGMLWISEHYSYGWIQMDNYDSSNLFDIKPIHKEVMEYAFNTHDDIHELQESDNLDDITTPGFYYTIYETIAESINNPPPVEASSYNITYTFFLEVLEDKTQIWRSFWDGLEYKRTYDGTTYSSWVFSTWKKTTNETDVVSKAANGLVPQLPNETTTTKYLRQDGIWQDPVIAGINIIYPVGSIYLSTVNTNPQTWLPGTTWIAWGRGRVPVGVDTSNSNFNTVEKTGGESTHTLTINEIPSHCHTVTCQIGYVTECGGNTRGAADDRVDPTDTTNTGGDAAHNNLQPYITCYMWKRTA
jgi:hypothetical protein